MNSLADKISTRTTAASRVIIFLIFSILVIIQSAQAQDQWRVFTTQNSLLPSNFISRIIIDRNNVKCIGTDNGMVKIDGNNWIVFDTTNTPLRGNGIIPRTVDRYNNLWITVSYNGIAKFDGDNWTVYDTANSGLPSNTVRDIKTDGANIKWMATSKGLVEFNDSTWNIYDTLNSGLPNNIVSTIAIENNVKWIGTYTLIGGMAKYNDTDWVIYNTTNSGIPSNAIRDIEIDVMGIKWIGTYFGGVGKFNSVINNWTVYNPQNSGLPDAYINSIIVENHIKWIGTQGGGLARFNDTGWAVFNPSNSPIPSYTILDVGQDSIGNLWICTSMGLVVYNENGIVGLRIGQTHQTDNFRLCQSYPNPFNSKSVIKYYLAKNSTVKLEIYDVLGREIILLVNQRQNSGIHEVIFDGTCLPSGIYFYRLKSEYFTQTMKLVLLK